jgi:hypothetical protein
MTKRNKIIYWIATLWSALGMASSGFFQITKLEDLAIRQRRFSGLRFC